jgi:hypothetical protein
MLRYTYIDHLVDKQSPSGPILHTSACLVSLLWYFIIIWNADSYSKHLASRDNRPANSHERFIYVKKLLNEYFVATVKEGISSFLLVFIYLLFVCSYSSSSFAVRRA